MQNIVQTFVRRTTNETEKETRSFSERTTESEEKMMCKKFNKLMKKTKITVYEISASNSLVKHKIVICLFERFIIKNEEQ